jgi:hypothetical protein
MGGGWTRGFEEEASSFQEKVLKDPTSSILVLEDVFECDTIFKI